MNAIRHGWRKRWFLALLVAALFSLRHPRKALPKILKAVGVACRLGVRFVRAPDAVVLRRLGVCQRCPIFYAPLATCGSPLKGNLAGLGCWCSMEAKAQAQDATCWKDDELGGESDSGWRVAGV